MKRVSLLILGWIVVAAPVGAQTADEKKASIAYVQGLRSPDGGFRTDAAAKASSLRATSAGLRALKYLGGELKDGEAAARFVRSCWDREKGGFSDLPGQAPDLFTTAVGIMAAALVDIPEAEYGPGTVRYLGANAKTFEDIRIAVAGLERIGKKPAEAPAWLEQIDKLRNPDGTYGKGAGAARMTGSAVVAALRLGARVDDPMGVLKTLNGGQRPDGGWGKEEVGTSDLETSYRVLRAFYMLKKKPERSEALRAFVGKCRNADGGYGVEPGKPSSIGATYFASILLHWLDEL